MSICLLKPVQLKLSIQPLPGKSTWADKIAIKTAKTGKVTVVVAVMRFFCRKKCKLQSANPGNRKPSCQKAESADFLWENSRKPRNLSRKTKKGWILNKIVPNLKKFVLNSTDLKLNCKKSHIDCTKEPDPSISFGLKVKNKTIRVLIDSGFSGDLL